MTSITTHGGPVALEDDDTRVWRRHPGDVARMVFRSLLLGALVAVTAIAPTALRNASSDLIKLLAQAPSLLRDALVGTSQLAAFLVPIGVLGALLIRRRVAEAALIAGAATASGVMMSLLIDWLDRAAPPQDVADLPSDWFIGSGFPSVSFVAALVGGAVAASPMLNTSWRRATWIGVGAAVTFQLLTATRAPVNLAVTVALGAVVGSAALVVVGSPQRRPGFHTLRTALAAGGLDADDLHDEDSHLGRRVYGGSAGGEPIRVSYVDRDDRDADLLARTMRSIRVHSIDDENLSSQPRRVVEHEALVTVMANQAGASVPAVLAVVPWERDSALIALTPPRGRTLSDFSGSDVSDDELDEVWRQLGALHADRIAHRALTADRIVIDQGSASLLGFEHGRLAATDDQLAADVAQLLVTTGLVVGERRAVDAALRTTPPELLESALKFVQRAALPAETRKSLRHDKGLDERLRATMQERLGIDELELAELDRISLMRMVTWVGFAVLAFFILTLVSSWSEISDAMSGIQWEWVPLVLGATLLGTVGGAMSLTGSVVRKVALGEATIIMFGQSFLNRFTPANAGGMAMRIRYLQKGGTQAAVATVAVGLTSAASGVLQIVFIVFFFVWSGSNPTSDIDPAGGSEGAGPDGTIILVFIAALAVALVVVAITPKLRRWLVEVVRTTLQKIRSDFGELARRPDKLGLLFGGAGIAKLATLVAFVMACRAFGIDLSFAELGALYLGASTVAAAVPTPGGVGAIEAALVFVLVNAGVEQGTAWAAVLLFRLINYWLITIPGYIALKASERLDLV